MLSFKIPVPLPTDRKRTKMKLAAIDIGSNAIRLQVVRVIRDEQNIAFKKLEYIRFPLRLGDEVFHNGEILSETAKKFEKLMRTFKLLIDLYEVDGYIATATSAMREADNGRKIVQRIATYFDLKIDVIDGRKEAQYINKAILPYLGDHRYVHIDVGGGSTEINLYEGRKWIDSESFRMGSVRRLSPEARKVVFEEIGNWFRTRLADWKQPIVAVGTGGNINKLYKLSNQSYKGSITLTELKALRAYVAEFTYEQRINLLKMNPDRADVILPAAEIYIEVMHRVQADRVMVPGIGLKDGLLYHLYEQLEKGEITDVQFLDQF